jgi:hypothetical protein
MPVELIGAIRHFADHQRLFPRSKPRFVQVERDRRIGRGQVDADVLPGLCRPRAGEKIGAGDKAGYRRSDRSRGKAKLHAANRGVPGQTGVGEAQPETQGQRGNTQLHRDPLCHSGDAADPAPKGGQCAGAPAEPVPTWRHLSGKTDKNAGKRKGRVRTRPRFVRGKRSPDGKGP